MQLPFEEFFKLVLIEAYRYRMIIVGFFAVISLTALGLALTWPKTYESATTVYVEQKSVIQPLMQGTAVATEVKDRARIAKEIMFSKKIMEKILEDGGWLKDNMDELKIDRISEGIKRRTRIANISGGLIKINYRDVDPKRAFETVDKFARLLLSESAGTQASESAEAFDFIRNQTKQYHTKLIKAEQDLKEFRSNNIDARPGTEATITTKINALQGNIENTTLQLKEMEIRQINIEKQLAGEAQITASVTKEGQYISRINELQGQLDTLRMNFHETYPDIVRVKQQMKDLYKSIVEEKKNRAVAKKKHKKKGQVYVEDSILINPLYQALRGQHSQVRTEAASLSVRLIEMKKMLNTELERAKRVYRGEAELVELTRDYEVNRDIYQDLLRRRERARLSMNIDKEQSGLTMRIQEPATMPLRPSGIRFMHIVIGGIVLGILVPIGLLCGVQTIDPRIRHSNAISEQLKLPILTIVPHLYTSEESSGAIKNMQILGGLVLLTIGIIFAAGALKYVGAI